MYIYDGGQAYHIIFINREYGYTEEASLASRSIRSAISAAVPEMDDEL